MAGGFLTKRLLATGGLILVALAMGPTVAAAAKTKLDLPIVFLTRAEEPRQPLAFVDPVVEDPGVWGARLAIKDNQTTGSFLGQKSEMVEVTVLADGEIGRAAGRDRGGNEGED